MLLLCAILGIGFCNWHQIGHDSEFSYRSSYKSKSKSSWSVKLEGYLNYPGVPFIIDDTTGLIWYFTQWERTPTQQYQVTVVDSESGNVKFNKKIECTGEFDCGRPLLTEDGVMIYYADKVKSVKSLNPDGSTGTFSIPNVHDAHDAAIHNGIYIFQDNWGLIRGVNIENQKDEFKYNASTNLLSSLSVSSNGYVYFAEMDGVGGSNANMFVVNAATGELKNKVPFKDSNDQELNPVFAVSDVLGMSFVVDEWPKQPNLLAFDTFLNKMIWNYTFEATHTDCTVPTIVGDKLVYSCTEFLSIGSKQWLVIIDAKSGKVLKKLDCKGDIPYSIFGDNLILVNGGIYIYSLNLETGKHNDLIDDDGLMNFYADSNRCIFYCSGEEGYGNIQTCQKKTGRGPNEANAKRLQDSVSQLERMSKRPREKVVATLEFHHEVFGEVFKGQVFLVTMREGSGPSEMLYLVDENGKRGKGSSVVFERAPDSPLPEKKLTPILCQEMEIPKNIDPNARIFRVKNYIGGERLLGVKKGDLLQLKEKLDEFVGDNLFINLRTNETGKYPFQFLAEIKPRNNEEEFEEFALPKYNVNISGLEIEKSKIYGVIETLRTSSSSSINHSVLILQTPKCEELKISSAFFEVKKSTDEEIKKYLVLMKEEKDLEETEGELGEIKEDEIEKDDLLLPYQEMLRFERVKRVITRSRKDMYSLLFQIDQLQKQVYQKHMEMKIAISKAKHIHPLFNPPKVPMDTTKVALRQGLEKEILESSVVKCEICSVREIDSLLNCGHVVCFNCFLKKMNSSIAAKCPWCKQTLISVRKLFID